MFQVIYEQTANWPESGTFIVKTPPLEVEIQVSPAVAPMVIWRAMLLWQWKPAILFCCGDQSPSGEWQSTSPRAVRDRLPN